MLPGRRRFTLTIALAASLAGCGLFTDDSAPTFIVFSGNGDVGAQVAEFSGSTPGAFGPAITAPPGHTHLGLAVDKSARLLYWFHGHTPSDSVWVLEKIGVNLSRRGLRNRTQLGIDSALRLGIGNGPSVLTHGGGLLAINASRSYGITSDSIGGGFLVIETADLRLHGLLPSLRVYAVAPLDACEVAAFGQRVRYSNTARIYVIDLCQIQIVDSIPNPFESQPQLIATNDGNLLAVSSRGLTTEVFLIDRHGVVLADTILPIGGEISFDPDRQILFVSEVNSPAGLGSGLVTGFVVPGFATQLAFTLPTLAENQTPGGAGISRDGGSTIVLSHVPPFRSRGRVYVIDAQSGRLRGRSEMMYWPRHLVVF